MGVREAFDEFRSRLELDGSYQETISARHDWLRGYLENHMPGIRTQLIGSLQRRTRIDPPSGLQGFDIDILAELGSFVAWIPGGITCDAALDSVEGTVKGNYQYQKMGVQEDRPSIVIPYEDGSSLEIVPAYQNMIPNTAGLGRSYWVPKRGAWKPADYDYDADWISKTNDQCDDRLVPCIKMLKAWRRERCPQLRSYHLEVLVASRLPTGLIPLDGKGLGSKWPYVLAAAFELLKDVIDLAPLTIPGSASEPADVYLQPVARAAIKAVIVATAGAAWSTFSLTEGDAVARWRLIFGAPFPSS